MRRGRRGNLDLNDEDEDMEYEIFEVPVYPPNCKPRREQPDDDEDDYRGGAGGHQASQGGLG